MTPKRYWEDWAHGKPISCRISTGLLTRTQTTSLKVEGPVIRKASRIWLHRTAGAVGRFHLISLTNRTVTEPREHSLFGSAYAVMTGTWAMPGRNKDAVPAYRRHPGQGCNQFPTHAGYSERAVRHPDMPQDSTWRVSSRAIRMGDEAYPAQFPQQTRTLDGHGPDGRYHHSDSGLSRPPIDPCTDSTLVRWDHRTSVHNSAHAGYSV